MKAMSPEIDRISPLLAPLGTLSGIGPRYADLLRKVACGPRVMDLLFTLPSSYTDRRSFMTLAEARTRLMPGATLTARLRVLDIAAPSRPRQPFRIRATDDSDDVEILFFHQAFIRSVAAGDELAVSGKLERYGLSLTMPHPDYMVGWARRDTIPAIDPVWPLTAGLFPSIMRRAMHRALDLLPPLAEWIPPDRLARHDWPGFAAALEILHRPPIAHDPAGTARDWSRLALMARERLAYDECLADQLSLALARQEARAQQGRSLRGDNSLRAAALVRFGHEPTGAQKRAISEIDADMEAPVPMMRLLQGDVGAGKTLVALLAMLRAVEAGAQAALMAPTEILASQHFQTLSRLSGVACVYLSGSVKGKARRLALDAIADGTARLIVGTHALFQEKVVFHDLALAVIDEQHRFGVQQRSLLGSKGAQTDILVMTATPIPRTLLLTQWGDLSVSRLNEKPPGRKPIQTSLHPLSTLDEVMGGITRILARGAQVFWVCPLVEESEVLDVAAAEARWADLSQRLTVPVGLAHGRQEIAQRQAELDRFRLGETRLLVATTVIEVGVDIPNASIMVIEHAERFGLAQLHQLRGRVGRGAAASFCLLIYDDATGATGKERLSLLRETEDGFLIADRDFRLRGGGDLTGNRQSGLPMFRLTENVDAEAILQEAHHDMGDLISNSHILAQNKTSLRTLLKLFDRDDTTRVNRAG
ncbi:ATP-dependent DNA helicase RecG [Asaia sp. VD9]|uniref:ATP-dependent DNA helicase RecG n=1 Tax=Asaia sp. VD9 TaxID=3081235 RepID=UPI00301929C0